eukprot:6932697-Prorocentrum_lima.AAC.1
MDWSARSRDPPVPAPYRRMGVVSSTMRTVSPGRRHCCRSSRPTLSPEASAMRGEATPSARPIAWIRGVRPRRLQ